MKKVLLLDTSFASIPLVNAIDSKKCEIHVAGANTYDHLVSHPRVKHINLNYSDIKETKRLANDYDYIIPGCNDVSYETAAAVCTDHPHLYADSFEILNNKALFRSFCDQHELPVPKTFDLVPSSGIECLVKPQQGFSGRGITKISSFCSEKDIETAFSLARKNSANSKFLIEEYIEGQLYSVSAFYHNGVLGEIALVKEFCTTDPYAVDISYVDSNKELLSTLHPILKSIVENLNIKTSLLHVQFIKSSESIYLIEATLRCPGDLFPILIENSTGMKYTFNYLSSFLPKDILLDQHIDYIDKNIMRVTMKSEDPGYLYSLKLNRNKIHSVFPLRTVIGSIDSKIKRRAAIVFIHRNPLLAKDNDSISNLSKVCLI